MLGVAALAALCVALWMERRCVPALDPDSWSRPDNKLQLEEAQRAESARLRARSEEAQALAREQDAILSLRLARELKHYFG